MGLRPAPSLHQLMRVVAMVCPRWMQPGGPVPAPADGNGDPALSGEISQNGSLVPGLGIKNQAEEDGEAEFDERRAAIRATRSGGRGGRGRGGAGGNDPDKDDLPEEKERKEAQAMLDGVCMSMVRVLAADLHAIMGR